MMIDILPSMTYIYVCLKYPNTCWGQRERCVYTVFMFSTLWLSGGCPGCWRSYCVLSPCPDVIYILACARCFLAALVYLPRTTASLCLHSHIAAFGVFTECVYTQYSLKCDGEKKYPLSLGFCEKILFLRSESLSPSQLFPVGCPLHQWMALSSGRTSLLALESHFLVILVSDWPMLSRCQRFVKSLEGGARWRPALAASVSSWAPQSLFLFT